MRALVDGSKLIEKYQPEEIQKFAIEVDGVMRELQREQERMQQGGYDHDTKPKGGDNLGLLMRALAGIIKVLGIDGYLRVGIMIILAFLSLRKLRAICKRRKKINIETEEEVKTE